MPTKDEKTIEKNDVTEPCYCICNQVAFGVMVACDNKKVMEIKLLIHNEIIISA